MRTIAGMDERALEKYMRTHRHDRVKMEMYHALTEMGYWRGSPDGSERPCESSKSLAAKNDHAG